MLRWSRSLPVVVVVGAVSVAGCGGSDYPGNANEVCKQSAAKIKGLSRPAGSDLHVYFIKAQSILSDEAKKLKAVKPPSDKQAAYQGFLSGLNRELVILRRATNTVATNPRGAVTLLQQQSSLSQDVSNKAKAAGLTQCAKSG